MDDAVLVQLNGAGSGDELSWEPLAAADRGGTAGGRPRTCGSASSGALRWVRHLIGERAETAAQTGDSVFQPTRRHPAVVVMIDEIDETGNIEGATKLLEFLACKQRKSAVILILAGQRATATWTGGSGVRINLSTVVTGMLARDSEAAMRSAPRTRSPTSPSTAAARPGSSRSGARPGQEDPGPGAAASTSAGSGTSSERSSPA